MTAVDPAYLENLADEHSKVEYITREVEKILVSRNKDDVKDIRVRASSAAGEILGALSPEGRKMYSKILYSSPEGPDGEDEWTRGAMPVGQAKVAMEEFFAFYKGL
jgi:hypothetical protein